MLNQTINFFYSVDFDHNREGIGYQSIETTNHIESDTGILTFRK